jgi:hypothetical protein
MRVAYIIILLVFFNKLLFGQVINIESKRFLKDTNGLVGNIGANFSINQNTKQVISLGLNSHIQYHFNKHRILAISDLSFIKAGDNDFVNSGFQHLRYNYKLANRITWEAFVQAQYNKVLLLDRRYLYGTGPRFKILKEKNIRVYAASLYMYEYQSQNNDSLHRFNNRISAYITLSINFNKVEFASTTFYQPNFANFNDYRIATDNNFDLEINNHLSFRVGFNLLYDTRQPFRIPATTYILKNGLSYRF